MSDRTVSTLLSTNLSRMLMGYVAVRLEGSLFRFEASHGQDQKSINPNESHMRQLASFEVPRTTERKDMNNACDLTVYVLMISDFGKSANTTKLPSSSVPTSSWQ